MKEFVGLKEKHIAILKTTTMKVKKQKAQKVCQNFKILKTVQKQLKQRKINYSRIKKIDVDSLKEDQQEFLKKKTNIKNTTKI